MEAKTFTQMPQTKQKKPFNLCRASFIFICVVLPILDWLVFYVYQNASAFTMAFTNKDGVLSFDNFVRFWDELNNPISDIRIALKNTFITFAIILVTFPGKILVSYFIYKKIPGAMIYRILFFLPSIIFGVALALVFTRMLGVQGFIAQWVQRAMDLDYVPELLADSRFANTVVLLHMVWMAFPGDLIIWGGTFARIPEEVLESAKIDGVNWWKEFTRIIVPLVWPTVALQFVLTFCGIFGASGSVFLLTKGKYDTITLDSWMYLQIYNNAGSASTSNVYNYMSAVGLIITVLAVTISLVIRRWTDKMFDDVEY